MRIDSVAATPGWQSNCTDRTVLTEDFTSDVQSRQLNSPISSLESLTPPSYKANRIHRQCIELVKTVFTVHFEYLVRICVLHRHRLPSGIQGAQAVFKARKRYSQHTSGIRSIQVVLKAID